MGTGTLNKIAFPGTTRSRHHGDGKLTMEIANRVRHGSVLGIDKSEDESLRKRILPLARAKNSLAYSDP